MARLDQEDKGKARPLQTSPEAGPALPRAHTHTTSPQHTDGSRRCDRRLVTKVDRWGIKIYITPYHAKIMRAPAVLSGSGKNIYKSAQLSEVEPLRLRISVGQHDNRPVGSAEKLARVKLLGNIAAWHTITRERGCVAHLSLWHSCHCYKSVPPQSDICIAPLPSRECMTVWFQAEPAVGRCCW